MKIEVNVSEVALTDEIEPFEPGDDETYPDRGPVTLADLVARQVVKQITDDVRYELTNLRNEVMKELFREALVPLVTHALEGPAQRTNAYGEPFGPPKPMREVLVEEVKKYINEPADNYYREKGSRLQVAMRAEIDAAFRNEIKAEVAAAREKVRARVIEIAAAELTKAGA